MAAAADEIVRLAHGPKSSLSSSSTFPANEKCRHGSAPVTVVPFAGDYCETHKKSKRLMKCKCCFRRGRVCEECAGQLVYCRRCRFKGLDVSFEFF